MRHGVKDVNTLSLLNKVFQLYYVTSRYGNTFHEFNYDHNRNTYYEHMYFPPEFVNRRNLNLRRYFYSFDRKFLMRNIKNDLVYQGQKTDYTYLLQITQSIYLYCKTVDKNIMY